VPGSTNNVYIGSTYPSGAASVPTVTLTASESAANLYLGNGNSTSATLDLGANTLTISGAFVIGQNGGIGTVNESGGSFTASNMYLESASTFAFGTKDVVNTLSVYSGSTATTTATGNVTGNVNVLSGSTLSLGANLSIAGSLDIENTGSIVHMNGNNISANTTLLGWYGNQAVTLDRGTTPGSLTATNLYVADNTLNLLTSDKVTNFYLSNSTTTLNSGVTVSFLQLQDGSTGTTTTAGNVTDNVNVLTGSTLNMGANLTLTGTMDVENTGSVVHMNGNNISAATILLG
jgi:fibronectin-binding autotransporter adhesin